MKWVSNPKVVRYTPIVTQVAFNVGTLMHIIRMWTEGSSTGQSFWGWWLANFALLLWCNWYRVFTPGQKIPIYTAVFSIIVNTIAALTVFILR
jgi:hypothetical protein